MNYIPETPPTARSEPSAKPKTSATHDTARPYRSSDAILSRANTWLYTTWQTHQVQDYELDELRWYNRHYVDSSGSMRQTLQNIDLDEKTLRRCTSSCGFLFRRSSTYRRFQRKKNQVIVMTKDDARTSYTKSAVINASNLNTTDNTHNLFHIHNCNTMRILNLYTIWKSMVSNGFPHILLLYQVHKKSSTSRTRMLLQFRAGP